MLASMMEHSCAPTCELEVAIPRQGSVITLRTIADVEAGQALSISYVGLNLPTAERRRQLRFQCKQGPHRLSPHRQNPHTRRRRLNVEDADSRHDLCYAAAAAIASFHSPLLFYPVGASLADGFHCECERCRADS